MWSIYDITDKWAGGTHIIWNLMSFVVSYFMGVMWHLRGRQKQAAHSILVLKGFLQFTLWKSNGKMKMCRLITNYQIGSCVMEWQQRVKILEIIWALVKRITHNHRMAETHPGRSSKLKYDMITTNTNKTHPCS